MSLKITTILLFVAVFLPACGASSEYFEPTVTSVSPPAAQRPAAQRPAAEINAAAERAGANEQDLGENSGEPAASPEPAQTTEQDGPTPSELIPTRTSPANQDPAAGRPAAQRPGDGQPATNRRVDVGEIGRFPQLLPFDGIRPVYEPTFVSAEEAPLDDNELIIGIALGREAKAYSITVLRFREMVNDELAGIPTLVTW